MNELPKYNIYNNQIIKSKSTIEHIIPRRLFYDKRHSHDLINISFCDKSTNSNRSDFKFGDYHNLNSNIIKSHGIRTILDEDSKKINGFVDNHKRIFYPYKNADFGLISRSIMDMLSKYPYLYENLNEIIESPVLLSKWSEMPVSEFEYKRILIELKSFE
jgi:endonuclease I